MKVYAGMDPGISIPEVIAHAKRVEALGYDGLHVAETVHDALALSLIVAEHTSSIAIRTAVALAFPRSPTLTAYAAWDLAKFSGGRFELGLGTQIRQNIEGRYAMPWSDPVTQMGDYMGALEALFACFANGGPITYSSVHYRLDRLQPYFNPGPDDTTKAPVLWLGGVNPKICQLAGARAFGFITHPTNSNPRYLEEVCRPNLALGAKQAGRDPSDVELVIGTSVITGVDEKSLDRERERQRRLFAFLYSTPAYQRTLALYGWENIADELRTMVRTNNFADLERVVRDEILDALVPSATYGELPKLLRARFGHLGQGVVLPVPTDPADDSAFASVLRELQED